MKISIAASVTITRDSSDMVRVHITDEDSHARFVTVSMTPHDFAMAITGLGSVEATARVMGLENVGLKKITERRSTLCPIESFHRPTLEKWLLDNCQEEGWTIDPSLGSQRSIGRKNEGGCHLYYSVYRYENTEGDVA